MDFQARMAMAGRWTTLQRGGLLYSVGDQPNAVFGLGEGLLDVSIPIGRDEEVTIYRARPGFWVGDSALLAGTTRSITISAAAESRVFRIPISAVRRALAEHPEDWNCFFRLTHANASLAVSILAEVLSLPPRARFARMLIRLAGPDGTVRATQEDLGRMAGMSRAAFRRTFTALIELGALRTEYGCVQIVDRAALERASEES
ncbi:Crp/Fnr family transcriptional regulator [Rhodovulum strictum]|nr:Crp/Fnr family transcriptional regulator [Rhodovulum strictum]